MDWLVKGWHLWQEIGTDRDYFLPVPNEDLSGVRLVEARYTDGVAMSRACLLLLKATGGESLLLPEAVRFWTEHSERATLPSWCGCLPQFPASWLDLLGRWGVGRASTYVRTHQKQVKTMQAAVAEVAAAGRGWEVFEEDSLWEDLSGYLRIAGVAEELVIRQGQTLRRSAEDVRLQEMPGDVVSPIGTAPLSPTSSAASTVVITVDGEVLSDKAPSSPLSRVEEPLSRPMPGLGQYVVSIRAGSRRTRLHLVGACHRIPGRDYRDYEALGDQLPPASAYSDYCLQCWPAGRPERFVQEDDVDSAVSTSSSSEAGEEA